MRNIKYVLFLLTVFVLGCKKEFLNRLPQTGVTEENFFRTPADLETYTNGFYGMVPAVYEDIFSDNLSAYTGSSTVDNMLRGGVTPANVSGWDAWGNIRRINFMMDHLDQTIGDAASIKHFVGIARFFRAYVYYQEVKKYGDLPWYNHVIATENQAALTKPKDPRTLVVDSVMADLEYAAANIKSDAATNTLNSRITRWAALTLLARVAQHEGTFRKYHDELGLQSTASRFLERAVSASQTVMDNSGLRIYSTGNPSVDFRTLFCSSSLASNPEVIFLNRGDKNEGVANNSHTVFDYQWALSGSLANDFLMKDGTRFTDVPNYSTKTLTEIFTNRDPRMGETIMPPGFSTNPALPQPYVIRPSFGGYLQVKYYPRDPAQRGGFALNYTDLPIMRYAEVLLINAESKAELGTITQADLDKTVGLLRTRAGLPALNMAVANTSIDPVQEAKYPNITGANKGLLLEIRRERRTELACEGFRYDDLMRWKAGTLLAQDPKGMYVPALGALDVTGDGINDIAILENPSSLGPISSLPAAEQARLVKYFISDGTFYLSNGSSGNIMFTKDKTQKREFIAPKYYYFPIPLQQTVLNPNLKQSPGW
ncbi:RagB/SusD family nutrient uptake outer membrane protein [Pedobacter psychrodurus]|uniref:RagB/SusD family nutrient uptake outer membrane protein n=1 Tax=Pedobacter psychrodurus TaxID=2530456 RepID=UPI00292F8900|nr:RagB/SusD family nutrient uptake outer membrane protein [Pedobacter psychrodurus]